MGRVIAAEAWTSLEGGLGKAGVTRRRVAPQAPIDIFLAVEHPAGTRIVTFGLPDAEAAQAIAVPSAVGIEMRAVPTSGEGDWGRAEVRLLEPRYGELFEALAEDLVEHVMDAPDASTSVSRLADRLRRWESFLKVARPTASPTSSEWDCTVSCTFSGSICCSLTRWARSTPG